MIDSLARALSPAYGALRAFATAELRGHAAAVIDLIVEERLGVPGGFLDEMARIAAMPAHEAEVVLDAWAGTVAGAKPDRGTMKFALERFPVWCRECGAGAKEAWLAGIVKLAPAVKGLGDEGMAELCRAVELSGDSYAGHKLMESAASYAMTTDEAIRAVASMALAAVLHQRADLWLVLAQAFPAERMEESRDAEKLPEAMAKMVRAAGEEAVAALELAAVLAAGNASGARAACERLAAQAKPGLFPQARDVVRALGAKSLGAVLSRLPDAELAERVVETRREFGVQAGLRVLETGGKI